MSDQEPYRILGTTNTALVVSDFSVSVLEQGFILMR